MNFVENEVFNNYVEAFKKLSLEEKKKIVQNELKEMLAVLTEIDNGNEVLFNKEIMAMYLNWLMSEGMP